MIVGQQIGLLSTLGLVLATAIAGSILLRVQGFAVLSRMQRELAENRLPGRELVHGMMILVAGLLLLTPGFVTDSLGLLLFVPQLRDAAWKSIRKRVVVVAPAGMGGGGAQRGPADKTIDLDMSDYSSSDDKDSPWREK
ncbi:FxsA family protein [Chelativorans sp. AA-79]|uniref:FxsA family protein n=1 Tax=Chelativorans sp. AA-79 TaxID=3028735 RepID=UPI0023F93F7C|nr:FxsA family protein [Chelativorans sp. AA-79]WEX09605.1 FxsA family protein [Chelativorans sp. AA-79]